MYLYKFMPVSDHKERIDWIKKIIIDKEIYIPNVKKLNDPFELATQWQGPEQAKSNTAALYMLFQHENLIEKTGVLSFSKNFNNLLMWSHYGASHGGICLKFKIIDKDIYGESFKDVKYSSSVPTKSKNNFLWTKSKDWQYEQEVRYITEIHVNKNIPLHNLGIDIENVILGSKISAQDATKIVTACGDNIDTYLQKVQLQSKKYEIELSQKSPKEIKETYLSLNALESLRNKKRNDLK